MLKRKFFYIIVMVIVLVMPGVAGAWFAENRDDRPFLGRTIPHSGMPSGDLAVYDDIVSGTPRILMPVSRFFVPADTIDLDIPLTLLENTPLSSIDSLDRLMAGNLRFRLLIDEYKALQERADKLLKSLSIPYLDAAPWQPHEKAHGVTLNDEKKRIESKLDGVLLDSIPVSLKQNHHTNLSALHSQEGSLLSIHSKSSMENREAPLPVFNGNDPNSVENIEFGKNSGKLIPVISSSQNKNFPWIVKFFMDLFSYCISHRMEVLFYGAVVSMIGYFIALKIKTHG